MPSVHSLPPPEARTRGLSRRELLAFSTAVALTPWIGGLAQAAALPGDGPMSIGFLEGSDRLPALDHLPWIGWGAEKGSRYSVLPAADLPLGDASLLYRTVYVTIHGLVPDQGANCPEIDAASLEVLFPSLDPSAPGPFPFFAWGFKRTPGWNAGQRVTFPVPVEGDGQLRLNFLVRRPASKGSAGGVERFEASLTAGRESGRPKLQRGVYFLGLDSGAWTASKSFADPKSKRAALPCSLAISVEPAADE
jgi:hypothetical protein